MHIPPSLRITTLAIALSSVAFAQNPSPAPPISPAIPPSEPAVPSLTPQLSVVTQTSRVRAFNAGPEGDVRSLYLQNGSVVNLAPALGGQLGSTMRKGERVTVTGTKSEINGQSLVEAVNVRLNDQTFSANAGSIPPSPVTLAEGAVPPPPSAAQAPPSPPRRRNKATASARCGASADAPPHPLGFDGPPPPLPGGMAPPPPDGMAPPPPPPQD